MPSPPINEAGFWPLGHARLQEIAIGCDLRGWNPSVLCDLIEPIRHMHLYLVEDEPAVWSISNADLIQSCVKNLGANAVAIGR